MAEENKPATEETKPVATEEAKAEKKELASLKKENAELKKQNDSLELAYKSLDKRVGELQAQLSKKVDSGVIINVGSKLELAGSRYEVVHVDTTWEVGQLEAKGLLEEDATCLVLKKV